MMTYTIEVTDIDEDLLRRVDLGAHQQGQDRSTYLRGLLRRTLDEEEVTEFINAQVHEVRRGRCAQRTVFEAAHQKTA